MKTSLWQKLLQTGVAALAVATLPAHGASWWVEAKSDSQWTNRPLAELLSEAQGTNAFAQFYYARASFYGSGRARDLRESFTWLNRAAALGLADAQFMLSRFYFSGTGVAADRETGIQWAERAAGQGHADALAILGDAHANGIGAPLNVAKARQYFEQAIDGGSIWALDWFGHFLMNGEARTAAKTNYSAALQCFERAASNGMTHAVSHLLDFYTKGLGTPPNVERAVFWVRTAADRNDFEMMEKLASLYNEGVAEPRDLSESTTELLRRAAGGRASGFENRGSQSHTLRQLFAMTTDAGELCRRYRFGLGTSRDYISFAQWMLVLKRATEWEAQLRGRRDATTATPHIFDLIVEGKGSANSPEDQRIREAVTHVHRAIEKGSAAECRRIGELYRSGSTLTPESPSLAWLWLNRAVELKDNAAPGILRDVEGQLTAEQITKLRNRYLPRTRP